MKMNDVCWKPGSFIRSGLGVFVIVLVTLATNYLFTANMSYGFSPKTNRINAAGNLHEKPAADSPILSELKEGDEVTLILRNHEWYIVKLSDNRLGWAHESLFWEKIGDTETDAPKEAETVLAEASPEQKTLIVKVRAGRVREMPSVRSDIEYGLKEGDEVTHIKTKGDWYFVRREDDGSTGWAHKKLFNSQDSEDAEYSETEDVKACEIKDIHVDVTPEGEEKVIFVLTDFKPPKTFVLEEDEPKVVCDFPDARFTATIGRKVEVNARFVQRIRIGIHKSPKSKVRVVLDLVPDQDYEVEQTFFRKENLYTLTFKSAG